MQASIDMAAALGARVLTVVTGGTEPGTKGLAESRKRLADRVARHAPYARERDVRLALEPLNPMFGGSRTCIVTVRDALAVCAMADADNVGIAVDVYHVWWDSALAESLRSACGRICGYHLCDWLEDTRHMLLDRGMMGDGVADLKGIRALVEGAGYAGLCEVEVFFRGALVEARPRRGARRGGRPVPPILLTAPDARSGGAVAHRAPGNLVATERGSGCGSACDAIEFRFPRHEPIPEPRNAFPNGEPNRTGSAVAGQNLHGLVVLSHPVS